MTGSFIGGARRWDEGIESQVWGLDNKVVEQVIAWYTDFQRRSRPGWDANNELCLGHTRFEEPSVQRDIEFYIRGSENMDLG